MARPVVSVILRTRDRPLLLREALESLRAQTFRDFETVVIADGGATPPEGILSPAPGKGGLKLIHREAPHGRSRALNAGLDAARGKFIAYLDDDDLYRPDHLETLATFLSGGTYRVAYTDVEQVTQILGPDGLYHDGSKLFVYGRPFERDRLLSSNYISLIGLMHAANDLRYDDGFDVLEDWDYMIRLAEHERFHHIAKITAVYRVRDDQSNATTKTPWHGVEAETARRKLFEKHWHRQNVDSQMGLVDSFQNEGWLLRTERAAAEAARAAEVELATSQLRATIEEVQLRADTERENALLVVRDEAAQFRQAAAEREAALTRQILVNVERETAFAAESAKQLQLAAEREAALTRQILVNVERETAFAAESAKQLQLAAEREAALALEMTRSTTRMSELHQELRTRAEAELESALLAVREEAWQQLQAAAMRERELATELESTTGQLSAVRRELGAVRSDAWRQLQAAGERESALSAAWEETSRYLQAAGENERRLLATLHEIYASTSWKLLSPYFRLKAWLQRK